MGEEEEEGNIHDNNDTRWHSKRIGGNVMSCYVWFKIDSLFPVYRSG